MVAERSYPSAPVIRSRLVLEVLADMVGQDKWTANLADIELRAARDGNPVFAIASRAGNSLYEQVAVGSLDVAVANPSSMLTLAVRGTRPFSRPLPLRVLTVLPSLDQVAFAVRSSCDLRSVEDIAERQFPLRISVRGNKEHAVHIVMEQVFAACGFSSSDLTDWGGELHYEEGMPASSNRIDGVAEDRVDAVFDESAHSWVDRALASEMNLLGLKEEALRHLEAAGLRRSLLPRSQYSSLSEDVTTVDFSGWALYVRANAPEEFVISFCAALEARRDRIPWQGEGPLPLEKMCVDTPSTPFDVPLHDAAEAYWHARGYR